MALFQRPKNELNPPPIANEAAAHEILRVWGGPDLPQQVSLNTTWKDPAAWGILLADIARHAAKAYSGAHYSEETALRRIREGLDAEWQFPTDGPGRVA